MINIDDIDRKIIARLQIDGRASVTTLAAVLGLARGTVQARLTRLIDSRVIKRFTIDLGGLETHELVRAVMMIEVRGCGVWDLVIELETTSLYEFDSILSRIRELPGVSNSETCPLLRRIS